MSELEPLDPKLAGMLRGLPRPSPMTEAAKAALQGRLAASVAATGAAAAGSAIVGAATGKLIAVAVIAALAGAFGGVIAGLTVLAPEPRIVVRTEVVTLPAPAPAPAPVPLQEPIPTPAPQQPAPPVPSKPLPPKTKPTAAPAPSSTEERQLVDAIRSAVRSRQHEEALRLVAQHRDTMSGGQHAEERDSLEVLALVQAGRAAEARAAAKAFSENHPQSIFEPAVTSAIDAL